MVSFVKKMVPVREAMTEKVLTATPKMTIVKAAKLMSARSVGSIVVTQAKKPVGILTERDVLMKVVSANLKPSTTLVGKIMSKPVLTIEPDVDITEAARIMARNKIRRLPVVERGFLVGIITSSDISAISPELIEMSERSEMPTSDEIETSVCETCGEVTNALHEVNGIWVCENCRDTMSK